MTRQCHVSSKFLCHHNVTIPAKGTWAGMSSDEKTDNKSTRVYLLRFRLPGLIIIAMVLTGMVQFYSLQQFEAASTF